MKLRLPPWRSINTRITVVSLAIFVLSIWALALYAGNLLHDDLQQLLSEQQLSTVTIVASEIDQELTSRLDGLAQVASEIAPAQWQSAPNLQLMLEHNKVFQDMFNAGTFITDANGTVIASVPTSLGRVGLNYKDRNLIAEALERGKPAISEPVVGKVLKVPVISLAVPIRNAAGSVVGVLVGVTNMNKPNFLESIMDYGYGKTGGYLLADRKNRRFIAATDRSYVFQALPKPGVNSLSDRYFEGYEGSGVSFTSRGKEHLSSARAIKAAPWYVIATLPTQEAFAPIRSMQQRIFVAAALLTLVAGVLTWWTLRRELAPLLTADRQLAALRDGVEFPQALSITRQDEIGQLLSGFNRLLETLRQRENAQLESERRYRNLVEWTPEAIVVHDGKKLVFVNPAAVSLFGAQSASDLVGRPILELVHPDSIEIVIKRAAKSGEEGLALPPEERRFLRLDGTAFDVQLQSIGILYDGKRATQVALHDITQRKATEQKLRQLSRITEQAPVAIVITDLLGDIEYVNPCFTEVTGFTPAEVLGKNPRFLHSGQTPPQTYLQLWDTLQAGGTWRGEFRNRRKSGDNFVEQAVIAPVVGQDGMVTHYVAIKEDITVRKLSEQRLERLLQEQKAMLENDLIGIARIANQTFLWANPAMERMLGYGPGEMVGLSTQSSFLSSNARKQMASAAEPLLREGKVFRQQVEFSRKDGVHVWLDVSGAALYAHSEETIWACLDVTNSVRIEAELQSSLQEKTALLNEVHHRVKNNLQVITSLLRLEGGRTSQVETSSVLQEMQGRIRSMALVHETLYRSGSFASVDLHSYIGQVASVAFRAQASASGAVRLALDLAPLKTSLDQATPCGLLVNELISNSLKHAFPQSQGGEVRVTLQPSTQDPSSQQWRLCVSDTGAGLPPDFEARRGQSLGLQLVSDLARQLGGTLEIASHPGTSFTVTFPVATLKSNTASL